jgi:hypothetical protein
MKKSIMTFKEYSKLIDTALYRFEESNISYYDPTKGWVLVFNENRKNKTKKENENAI